MAVKLTKGGLVSYAPEAATATYVKKITQPVSSSSHSSSGCGAKSICQQPEITGEQYIDQIKAQAQAQAQATAQAQAQATAQAQAEAQKRAELITVRNQRVAELQAQNQESGILSSESSSYAIIKARENSEIAKAGKEVAANYDSTGEVQSVEANVINKTVYSTPTVSNINYQVIDTKYGSGKNSQGELVDGKFESRQTGTKNGIPTTEVIFVPNYGSERKATLIETKSFRSSQLEVQPIYKQEGIKGNIQDLQTGENIRATSNFRNFGPGFTGGSPNILSTAKSFGAGALVSGLGTVDFVSSLYKDPSGTLKGAEQGLIQGSENIVSGKTIQDLQQGLEVSPAFTLGKVSGEVAQDIVIGAAFGKAIDIVKLTKTGLSPKFKPVKFNDVRKLDVGGKSFTYGDNLLPSLNKLDDTIPTGIREIKNIDGIGNLQLIPGELDLPLNKLTAEQLKDIPGYVKQQAGFKGAFGYSDDFIESYAGKVGPVSTSSIDLFGWKARGKTNIFGSRTKLSPNDPYGDISLFGTPFDVTTGQARTRISRLGVDPNPANFLDILSGNTKFGKGNPQIVVFKDQTIGDLFKTKQFTPGELEVTMFGENVIKKTGAPAVTIINKKSVPIITADITDITSVSKGSLFTSEQFPSLSGFSSNEASSIFYPDTPTLNYPVGPVVTGKVNNNISGYKESSIVNYSAASISPVKDLQPIKNIAPVYSSSGRSRSYKTVSPKPPVYKSPAITKISTPKLPVYRIPTIPKILNPVYKFPAIVKTPAVKPFRNTQIKYPSIPKNNKNLFGVQIRRGGKFYSVGNYKTQAQALSKGFKLTSGSLAATYKLTGNLKLPKAPKGFYTKKSDMGTLFIEKRGNRLSKKSETKEIQRAKAKKKK